MDISKLGIKTNFRNGIINGHIIVELETERDELIEALIAQMNLIENLHTMKDQASECSRVNNMIQEAIEKACYPKKWDEIKLLLGEINGS